MLKFYERQKPPANYWPHFLEVNYNMTNMTLYIHTVNYHPLIYFQIDFLCFTLFLNLK